MLSSQLLLTATTSSITASRNTKWNKILKKLDKINSDSKIRKVQAGCGCTVYRHFLWAVTVPNRGGWQPVCCMLKYWNVFLDVSGVRALAWHILPNGGGCPRLPSLGQFWHCRQHKLGLFIQFEMNLLFFVQILFSTTIQHRDKHRHKLGLLTSLSVGF